MKYDLLREMLRDSPSVLWDCQEVSGNLQDRSGNGNHATFTAATFRDTTYRPNGDDYSVFLNGGNSVTRAEISTGTDNVTLETLINIHIIGQSNQRCLYNGNAGANGYGIYLDSTFRFLLGGVAFLTNGPAISGGTWYHVVMRRASGTWTYAINGSISGSIGGTAPGALNGSGTFGFGDISVQASWGYSALYQTALSDARITAHYAAWQRAAATAPAAHLTIR